IMPRNYSPKLVEIERQWYVVEAARYTLGRLFVVVARVLLCKQKRTFASHINTGDFEIVINVDKGILTGRKEEQKIYYRQSGRPGGLKAEAARHLRQRRPIKMIEEAVRGMLPKNTLGKQQGKKLKVYAGAEHPHQAQKPAEIPAAALRA